RPGPSLVMNPPRRRCVVMGDAVSGLKPFASNQFLAAISENSSLSFKDLTKLMAHCQLGESSAGGLEGCESLSFLGARCDSGRSSGDSFGGLGEKARIAALRSFVENSRDSAGRMPMAAFGNFLVMASTRSDRFLLSTTVITLNLLMFPR